MAKVHLITSPFAGAQPRKRQNTRIRKGKSIFSSVIANLLKIVCFLPLFVLFSLVFRLVDDPRYRVKEIQIDGLKYFSDVEVKKSVDMFLNCKIISLNTDDVKHKLNQIPFIEDCSVEKDTKLGKIIIHVQEMSPYATLFIDDQMFLISHTGKILKKIMNIKEAVGPLITGVSRQNILEPGAYINDENLWSALNFWYEYNQVPKNKDIRISEIVIDTHENLKVFFDEIPCETRWKTENLKRQIQNFSIALNKVDITQIQCNEYIDMRFNDDIIYK
ncbi:MAG: cell division protein FtsQ/DivIB [Candidatus Hydrogenedens sp.]